MASRRILKKQINVAIADVIDECYDRIYESPKKEEALNKIIDEAVELFDNLIVLVNNYRNADNKGTYFAEVETMLAKQVEELSAKIATA